MAEQSSRRPSGGVTDEKYRSIAVNIARHHHERYDGKGYPDGLKGEEIPLKNKNKEEYDR